MTILMVTRPIAPPWDEGSKNLVYQIAINNQNQVFVLLTYKDIDVEKKDNLLYRKIYRRAGNKSEPVYTMSLTNKLELFWSILKNEIECDIYHFFFGPRMYSFFLFKQILKLKNKKSVQTIVSTTSPDQKIEQLVFADQVITLSDYMRDRLYSHGIKNVEKIYPGIDLNKFRPDIDNSSYRKKLNVGKNNVILYAGHIWDKKSVLFLLETVQKVIAKIPEVKFIIACRRVNQNMIKVQGFLAGEIKRKKLEESIIFLADVEDMPQLISLSNLVIHPVKDTSLRLEIPLILLESLAEEKPIIVPDIQPLNELLSEDVGIKVEPENSLSLSEAIVRLIKNEDERKSMGYNGRKMVARKFNIELISKEYNNIYNKLLL